MPTESTQITDPTIRAALVMDALYNAMTGMGTTTHDPMRHMQVRDRAELDATQLDILYTTHPLARRIVDLVVDDEFRKPFTVEKIGDDEDQGRALSDELARLQVVNRCSEARKWARLYGGGAILVRVVGDADQLDKPLDPRRLRRIDALTVIDRHDLRPSMDWYTRGGEPRFYGWTPTRGGEHWVHASRIIRFEGLPVPNRERVKRDSWGQSVVDLVWDEICRVDATEQGIGRVSAEFVRTVLTLPNLIDQLLKDGADTVEARYSMMRLMQSVFRMTLLDNQETMTVQTPGAVGGLADLVDQVRGSLAANSNYNTVRLWGETPGGLNASGKTDERFYDDFVAQNQRLYDRPPLEALLDLVFSAQLWGSEAAPTRNPFGGPPDGWELCFPPLRELSETEQADLRAKTSAADASDISAGILDADEVAASRYGSGTYSTQTQLLYPRGAAPEEENGEPEPPDDPAVEDPPPPAQDADEPTSYRAPEAVAKRARAALAHREELPRSARAMQGEGLARAQQLAGRQPISRETVQRMANFFNRHTGTMPEGGLKREGRWSKWLQAWEGWGGAPGVRWAFGVLISEAPTAERETELREQRDRILGETGAADDWD